MVRCQALLIDYLGIHKLFAVVGGSMGGMQVLEWASMYPKRVFTAISIASAAFHSAQASHRQNPRPAKAFLKQKCVFPERGCDSAAAFSTK